MVTKHKSQPHLSFTIGKLNIDYMNREKAIKILGDTITEDGGLYNLGHYISWNKGDDDVCLDCRFSADELEAIAWWIKNN